MSVQYDFRESLNSDNEDENQLLYPRFVSRGTIDAQTVYEAITSCSSFTIGDVEGMMAQLTQTIRNYLAEGYAVELGKMAIVNPKVSGRKVANKKEIRSPSIEIENVNFTSTSWFSVELKKKAKLSRAKNGFQSSRLVGEEELLQILDKYLIENVFITRTKFSELSGLLKNKSLTFLKDLVSKGVLHTEGRGSHLIFLRSKQKNTTSAE